MTHQSCHTALSLKRKVWCFMISAWGILAQNWPITAGILPATASHKEIALERYGHPTHGVVDQGSIRIARPELAQLPQTPENGSQPLWGSLMLGKSSSFLMGGSGLPMASTYLALETLALSGWGRRDCLVASSLTCCVFLVVLAVDSVLAETIVRTSYVELFLCPGLTSRGSPVPWALTGVAAGRCSQVKVGVSYVSEADDLIIYS